MLARECVIFVTLGQILMPLVSSSLNTHPFSERRKISRTIFPSKFWTLRREGAAMISQSQQEVRAAALSSRERKSDSDLKDLSFLAFERNER